jgi:hypothetical protein
MKQLVKNTQGQKFLGTSLLFLFIYGLGAMEAPQMRLQVPYWAKNYIAPCKSLIISNLQGDFFRLPFGISKPLFSQYQSVSCCYSAT